MRSIVLLSGGLDSTVAMAAARQNSKIILALTFNYGQRAVEKEIEASRAIAQHYGVEHKVITLGFLKDITKTSLVNRDEEIPRLAKDVLDHLATTQESAARVWVPNRNGVFINIAAAFAESLECEEIIAGFNAEEGVTFPDNTPEYMAATTLALSYSTQHAVRIISPTVDLTKVELVKLGKKLQVPLHLIWSCYHGNTKMCGACESCQRLKRALAEVTIADAVSFAS
jgi:7-cyano-7-deazaguanine synthase